jgi:hypothetical protein
MDDYICDKAKADAELDAIERAEAAAQSGSRQVWERMPRESAKAFAAFAKYRDLSTARTMKKVAEMSQCSAQNIHRWARRWVWTHRAAQFDIVEEEKFREQAARDRLDHRRRQVRIGQAMQSVAVAGLRELQAKLEQKLPLNLAPSEVALLQKLGDDLESRGLGEDNRGAGRYTRINVIIGTQEAPPDALAEASWNEANKALPDALCDAKFGEVTVDGDRKLN